MTSTLPTSSALAASLRDALHAEPALGFLAGASYVSLQLRFDGDGLETAVFHLDESHWVEDAEGVCEPDPSLEAALQALGWNPAAARTPGCPDAPLCEDVGAVCLHDVPTSTRPPLCARLWEICADHARAAHHARLTCDLVAELELA